MHTEIICPRRWAACYIAVTSMTKSQWPWPSAGPTLEVERYCTGLQPDSPRAADDALVLIIDALDELPRDAR